MSYLTASEAAGVLRVTSKRVRILATEGRFPKAYKAGKIWLIPEEAIKAFKAKPAHRPKSEGLGGLFEALDQPEKLPMFNAAGDKRCPRCEEYKPVAEYHKHVRSKTGLMCYCKRCHSSYCLSKIKNDPDLKRRHNEAAARSRKGEAGPVKKPSVFYTPKVPRYTAEEKARWISFFGKNWGAKKHQLSSCYGITLDEYIQMYSNQTGCCAICGENEIMVHEKGTTWRLGVDHNHETGVNRELLCLACNQAIGKMRESPELLEKAAAYLRKHSAEP